MADLSHKGGAFAKAVQKTLTRTKTKVLQKVGKAEKTSDDTFKDDVANFQKQHAAALRLQKEMKHYIVCVKALTMAANDLFTVVKDIYEEEWLDPQTFHNKVNSLELMQTNYEAELAERVAMDVNGYIEQFPLYKEKINKRRRKLLDYDNSKHEYESLATAKKPDHAKICKAQESLQESKSMFDEINTELHRDLPKFYDYRIEFLASNLQKLFLAEGTYHTNCGKISDELTEQLQALASIHAEETERLNHKAQNDSTKPADLSLHPHDPEAMDLSSLSVTEPQSPRTNGHAKEITPQLESTPRPKEAKAPQRSSSSRNSSGSRKGPARPSTLPSPPPVPSNPASPKSKPTSPEPPKQTESDQTRQGGSPLSTEQSEPQTEQTQISGPEPAAVTAEQGTSESGNPFEQDDDENNKAKPDDSPSKHENSDQESSPPKSETSNDMVKSQIQASAEASTDGQPQSQVVAVEVVTSPSESKPSTSSTTTTTANTSSQVLYQVMATHAYAAEDDDELTFEVGDIINVVEYDDEEEQDEGWLMGVHTSSNVKGVFPANFTQKIKGQRSVS